MSFGEVCFLFLRVTPYCVPHTMSSLVDWRYCPQLCVCRSQVINIHGLDYQESPALTECFQAEKTRFCYIVR